MPRNLREFGATGVIGDDALPAWKAASAYFASRGGGHLVVPNNSVGRDGTAAWCINWGADNVVIEHEPGARTMMAAGMPDAQIALVHLNLRKGITFVGGVLDGNWGARVNVDDSKDGYNHATRTDPALRCVSVRGSRGVSFLGTQFRNAYGDFAWVGHEVADNDPTTVEAGSEDVLFEGCVADVAARNGITLGGPTQGVRIIGGSMTNTWAGCVDLEHAGASDLEIVGLVSKLWWNAGNPVRDHIKAGITLDGSGVSSQRIVVDRCDIEGSLLIQRVVGARVSRSRFTCPWTTAPAWAPAVIRFECNDIMLDDVDLVTHATWSNPTLQTTQNVGRAAAIIQYYAAGTTLAKPRNVTLHKVRTRATGQNVHGVSVIGTDGASGVVRIVDCEHDGTRADGTSNGGHGLDVFSEKPDMDVYVRGFRTRNATGAAHRLRFTGNAVNAMKRFDVDELHAVDDQMTATSTAVLEVGAQRHAAAINVGTKITKSAAVPATFVGWP